NEKHNASHIETLRFPDFETVKLNGRIEYEVLGEVVAQFRQELGLTQRALARKLGRTETSITKIEAGSQRVDLVELLDIARALRIPLEDLTGSFTRAVEARVSTVE